MKTKIELHHMQFEVDLKSGIDISIPVNPDEKATKAWYCPSPTFRPVMNEYFTGQVTAGGPVNFFNIGFNPHAHCTHTECVGHISSHHESIDRRIRSYHCLSQLISVSPTQIDTNDFRINRDQVLNVLHSEAPIEALIIRTYPNSDEKKYTDYSATNPPFVEPSLLNELYLAGVKHILIDLPSVDKEEDGGALAAHHAFWNYPADPRLDATITELVYIPESVQDDLYFLNLQVAPFVNDAAPSRPVLYPLSHVTYL